jgi:hypothetical protein
LSAAKDRARYPLNGLPDLGIKMQEPTLKFAVTCPDCALESLAEIPIAVIANALLTGKGIRLRASCHDQYWTATFLEREQLRRILADMNTDAVRSSNSIGAQAIQNTLRIII